MTMITKILKRRRHSIEKKNGQSVGCCVVLNWYLLGVKIFGSHAHLAWFWYLLGCFPKISNEHQPLEVYHHATFLVDLEALPSTQDIKCDDVGNWRNNSNDKFYFSVEWMDDNSAQVTAAESSDPDVATLKREYYMQKHDNDFKKRIDILFRDWNTHFFGR